MSDLPLEIVREAIAWQVRLASGIAGPEEERARQAWCAADPRHALAWERVQAVGQRFAGMPGPLARRTLAGASVDPARRRVLKQLMVAGVLVAGGLPAYRALPWQALLAERRTGSGERQRIALADGGTLYLNSGTALDIDYGPAWRLIRLYRGEILVQTAADRDGRPFLVSTAQGRLEALGTRFRVREHADRCELAVFEGAVQVSPLAGAPARVEAGQQLWFDAHGVGEASPAQLSEAAWVEGHLVARDLPLGRLVEELARHRPGRLDCAAPVAGLRISGVFPLDDLDGALRNLTRTLPVALRYRTRYWVTLVPA